MFRTQITIVNMWAITGDYVYYVYARKWYKFKDHFVYTAMSVEEAYCWIGRNYLYYNIADIR